jgi:hypothetical protein
VRTTIGRNGDAGYPAADDTIDLIQPEWSA